MTARSSGLPRERGQTLPLVVLFMVLLLACVGLVIDVGVAKVNQRRLQASLDMAVLAGARELPNGPAASRAEGFLDDNHDGLPWAGEAPGAEVTGHRVRMTGARTAATTFLTVLGIDALPYRATAAAGISTYVGFSNVAPWAVTRAHVQAGSGYTSEFKLRGRTDYGHPSLRGTISIRSGDGCAWSNGVDERRILNGSLGVCEIGVAGDDAGAEAYAETILDDTGNSNGHLHGLPERGARTCDATCLAEFTEPLPGGRLRLTDDTHPNAILVPIITAWDRRDEMPVVGFVWFAITRWDDPGVYGRFLEAPALMRAGVLCGGRPCSEGEYVAGSPGGKVVRLVE